MTAVIAESGPRLWTGTRWRRVQSEHEKNRGEFIEVCFVMAFGETADKLPSSLKLMLDALSKAYDTICTEFPAGANRELALSEFRKVWAAKTNKAYKVKSHG